MPNINAFGIFFDGFSILSEDAVAASTPIKPQKVKNTILLKISFKDKKFIEKSKLHGLKEILFSMHGYGQYHDKIVNKNLTISTWQSIHDMPKKFFEQFDFIIGDEAHGYKADRLGAIMKKLTKASYRIGTTGTLDGEVHKLVVEGHFGPAIKLATTKELMDRKLLSELEINCIILKYPEEVCNQVNGMSYHDEMDFIVSHPKRNRFIARLAKDLKGNTLILFQFVDKHGKILYNMIKELTADQPDRKIFFAFGGTEALDRKSVV